MDSLLLHCNVVGTFTITSRSVIVLDTDFDLPLLSIILNHVLAVTLVGTCAFTTTLCMYRIDHSLRLGYVAICILQVRNNLEEDI